VPDLIILDICFGDDERLGLTILKWIRGRFGDTIPVIMLTGIGQDELEPLSFELGASDFTRKAININGLLARVHTRLKRTYTPIILDDYLQIDLDNWVVCIKQNGEWHTVHLEPREWEVFKKLFTHPGRVIPRNNFLENIFPEADDPERALNVCVSRLRSLLEPDPPNWRYILTRHGIGYLFQDYRGRS